jgi:AraC-like DNA-binding protein
MSGDGGLAAIPRQHRPATDWIQRSPQQTDVERIEAFFSGKGYAMHRHDTYAIGRTLAGVQSFNYRGSTRHSQPGGTMVLHPDEQHDGQAGTGEGFRYRMIYVEPALFQQVLGGKPLPFIEGGLSTDPRLFAASEVLLQRMDCTIDRLEQDDAMFDLATALQAVSGSPRVRPMADYAAAQRARDYIHASPESAITLDELADASGQDRWSLSRDFRYFFGTSPHRYLTMRRLDLARRLMISGVTLADAAATAGFTDQAHMTRHFTKTYGIPPRQWLNTLGVCEGVARR